MSYSAPFPNSTFFALQMQKFNFLGEYRTTCRESTNFVVFGRWMKSAISQKEDFCFLLKRSIFFCEQSKNKEQSIKNNHVNYFFKKRRISVHLSTPTQHKQRLADSRFIKQWNLLSLMHLDKFAVWKHVVYCRRYRNQPRNAYFCNKIDAPHVNMMKYVNYFKHSKAS